MGFVTRVKKEMIQRAFQMKCPLIIPPAADLHVLNELASKALDLA